MSKTEKFLGLGVLIAIVIAAVALLSVGSKASLGAVAPTDLNSTNFTQLTASDGLAVGSAQQFQVSSTGAITNTSTGTTTVGITTSSTAKGICFNVNATSTNTAVNLTFAASTTAISTVGIIPVLRYGACP